MNSPFEAPRTAAEETMTSLWSEALGVTPIGIHDTFLDLGGDSLIAMTLKGRIEELFGRELSLRFIFESTPAQMCASLLLSGDGSVKTSNAEGEGVTVEQLLATIDSLSDDEVDLLIESDDAMGRAPGGGRQQSVPSDQPVGEEH